jgi:hypothetical protein
MTDGSCEGEGKGDSSHRHLYITTPCLYCNSELLRQENIEMPEKWATLRPEQLKPADFIDLTADLFGEAGAKAAPSGSASGGAESAKDEYVTRAIWRKALFGNSASAPADNGSDENEDSE